MSKSKHHVVVVAALLIAACNPPDYDLTVLHTNDRHSHWLGLPNGAYDPTVTGDGTVGGAARWATLVAAAREENPDTLLISAGDFTMGTLLVAAEDSAADLNLMQEIGYDAAALGNHEFDWGPAALADMIAAASEPRLPLLCANIQFDPDDPADDALEAMYGPEGESGKYIHPYIVRELPSGTKVGIFGLMGLEAASVSNALPVTFSGDLSGLVTVAQATVDTLRDDEDVDVVILAAHLGIILDGSDAGGETIEIGKRTHGIDLILSGHNHTMTNGDIAVVSDVEDEEWTSWTMETGSYGRFLGRYDLARSGGDRTVTGILQPVDDTIIGDATVQALVDALIDDVETSYLTNLPLVPEVDAFLTGDMFQMLTTSDFDLIRYAYESNNLGNLAADAMRQDCGAQVAAVSNGGDLRESLLRVDGGFNVSDTFIATPLGTGPDGALGYPLVAFYLNLMELKLVLEATMADLGLVNNDYMLTMSGMRVEYDSSGSSFGRMRRINLYDNIDESDAGTDIFSIPAGGFTQPQFDTLISICTTSYIAGFLINFNLSPKDEHGNVITLDEAIVRDGAGDEVKLWYSLQRRLAEFGVAGVPDQYNDDEAVNPLGPYYRRGWDYARHGQP